MPVQVLSKNAEPDQRRKGISASTIDTTVPSYERFKWPKIVPPLSEGQKAVADDFMKYWHNELPRRYQIIENFNHRYPLKHMPDLDCCKTLEIGAGIGGHLAFEPLQRQEYHCIELRESMAEEIRRKYPQVTTVTGDCQRRIPYEDSYFERVVVIHVLEHLPNLPAAMDEIARVLKPGGVLAVVLPCDPGLAYEISRKISAERLFKRKYKLPYRWLIRREHINSSAEVLHALRAKFEIFDTAYFPLLIPVVNLNLCIGVTAQKWPSLVPEQPDNAISTCRSQLVDVG